MNEIRTFSSPEALAGAAAAHVVAVAREAVRARGRFSVALSGGSTPRRLYRLLAGQPFASQVEWAGVHVFWSDERCVPLNHPESNYRLAEYTLLRHVPIPTVNIHPIDTALEPEQAALDYEGKLRQFFAGQHPDRGLQTATADFDLVLLGLGEDGHTASLFAEAHQATHKTERWVIAHYVDRLSSWRITLTPAAINAARYVTFLVSGANKARILQRVLRGPSQPEILPAQIINPTGGQLLWLADADAAQLL